MGGQIRRGWIWRFWGAPVFSREVPKYLFLKSFGTSGRKIGAPQKRQIQPRRIQPPICGPLILTYFTQIEERIHALDSRKTLKLPLKPAPAKANAVHTGDSQQKGKSKGGKGR